MDKVTEGSERDGALVLLGLARLGGLSELLRDGRSTVTDLVRHTGKGCNLRSVRRFGDAIDQAVSVGINAEKHKEAMSVRILIRSGIRYYKTISGFLGLPLT